MKKNKKYLVFLLASVMFAACNSASSPKGVVKNFIKDAESDDAWKIKNYILQNDDTVYVNKWIEEPGVNPQIKIKEQSINDDTTAIVEVTNYENRNIKIKLVKEKGEWKISNPIKLLSPLPEDPSIVVSKYLNAYVNVDIENIKKYGPKSVVDRYEELLKNIDEQTLDSFKNLLGPKARFDVYDEKVNATRDSATVFVQEIKKDSYDTYLIIYLAKENREWKVLNEDPFFL